MKTLRANTTDLAERSLLVSSLLALLLLALGLAITSPAHAAGNMTGAEKLRRLNIMLMVTGLRCRKTPDNFQVDYRRFVSRHVRILDQASAELHHQLAARYGTRGAQRAYDRLSTSMANEYGLGHPWLNCHQLKQVTRDLVGVQGRATLLEAADQLLANSGSPQLAYTKP